MKKYILLLTLNLFAFGFATAQVGLKDAAKAMLKIHAFDAKGKLVNSGTAFFVDANGTAVTSYQTLQDANRAIVTDFKGKQYEVVRILGANATTDLVKFTTSTEKKNEYFDIATSSAKQGALLSLVQYSTNKKAVPTTTTVKSVEPYNDYSYYQIDAANDSTFFTCPLLDEEGKLFAIVQPNVGKNATTACAIDARFAQDLKITAASALSSDLRTLKIAKALPTDKSEALSYLYMLPSTDSTACLTAYNDFIAAYPNVSDGYAGRAALQADWKHYAEAEADYNKALELAEGNADTGDMKADAIHYSLSNLIYRSILTKGDTIPVYPGWTMTRAESEADKAYSLKPEPLYLSQKGYCQYAQRNYMGAYQSFEKVSQDKNFATSEIYFSAARSLERAGGDSAQVLALLDSCIAKVPQPATSKYAQYYLERSQRYLRLQRYRDAVFDYNEYEKLIGPKNLNDTFYYLRAQAELEGRMYQQALDDIRTAIATSSQPILYRVEEALILLRAGEFESAITAAQNVLKDLPENPDCYKIIGIAYGELGNKTKAQTNLNKAKELGDDTVDTFIQKYK